MHANGSDKEIDVVFSLVRIAFTDHHASGGPGTDKYPCSF
jgi:hypothetical protein